MNKNITCSLLYYPLKICKIHDKTIMLTLYIYLTTKLIFHLEKSDNFILTCILLYKKKIDFPPYF